MEAFKFKVAPHVCIDDHIEYTATPIDGVAVVTWTAFGVDMTYTYSVEEAEANVAEGYWIVER